MLTYIIIGLIVGIIMGLTGAGGSLISIPLLISFLSLPLKEATTLSLIIVLLSTLINLVTIKSKLDFKLIITLVTAGTVGNVLTLPLKQLVPDLFVGILILLISGYSVLSIWQGPGKTMSAQVNYHPAKTLLIGFFLGFLTTITGLGGGIVLMPILMKAFSFTYEEALPNSLASVFFISGISLVLQWSQASALINMLELGFVIIGIIFSVILIQRYSSKLLSLRKITFTLVAVYSTVSIMRSVWI